MERRAMDDSRFPLAARSKQKPYSFLPPFFKLQDIPAGPDAIEETAGRILCP
jgi:hypothetical protein